MEPLIPPNFDAPNQFGFLLRADRDWYEALNDLSVRGCVQGGLCGPERATAGQDHGDQELVSQVLINRNTRFEPGLCGLDSELRDFLCRDGHAHRSR